MSGGNFLLWFFSLVCLAVGLAFAWGGLGSPAKAKHADEPIITPPPKKEEEPKPIPFDADGYVRQEVARLVASYPRYNPNNRCLKCGAGGLLAPKDEYRTHYTIPPHDIERKNYDAWFDRQCSIAAGHIYWPVPRYWVPNHTVEGAGYISRRCIRCGWNWKELASDEEIPPTPLSESPSQNTSEISSSETKNEA